VDVTEQLPFPPSQEQFILTFPGFDMGTARSSDALLSSTAEDSASTPRRRKTGAF